MSEKVFMIGRRLLATLAGAAILFTVTMLIRDGRDLWSALRTRSSILGPCEVDESLFPRNLPVTDEQGVLDQWNEMFHERVAGVFEEHLTQLNTGGNCEEGGLTPMGPALESLVEDMPGWRSKGIVYQRDMPAVVIDYLNAFTCSLKERAHTKVTDLTDDLTRKGAAASATASQSGQAAEQTVAFVDSNEYFNANIGDSDRIDTYARVAQETVQRVLTYLSGRERLRPLDNALQCLELSTIDINNITAVFAQLASQLPRAWNTRMPLFTPAP